MNLGDEIRVKEELLRKQLDVDNDQELIMIFEASEDIKMKDMEDLNSYMKEVDVRSLIYREDFFEIASEDEIKDMVNELAPIVGLEVTER